MLHSDAKPSAEYLSDGARNGIAYKLGRVGISGALSLGVLSRAGRVTLVLIERDRNADGMVGLYGGAPSNRAARQPVRVVVFSPVLLPTPP